MGGACAHQRGLFLATINGTPGNDLIDELTGGGSTTVADTVNAGSGNDVIQMYQNIGGVIDIVHGQAGTDTFRFTIGVGGSLSIANDPNGGLTGLWDSATGDISFDGIEAFDLTYTIGGGHTLGSGNDIVTDLTSGSLNITTGGGGAVDDGVAEPGALADVFGRQEWLHRSPECWLGYAQASTDVLVQHTRSWR